MNRATQLARLAAEPNAWDIIVIGGGATGLGTALDAASRGYRTVLLEQSDFAKATSSRSTKLIHGGFRYLKQGNVSLVRESLHERGLLLRNAPHLVHPLPFIVPAYQWWEKPYYGIGLTVYDKLAGSLGIGATQWLGNDKVCEKLPGINPQGLQGGVQYFDGQFDDARLALAIAQTIPDCGGVALNYMRVVKLIKEKNRVAGVIAEDVEAGCVYELRAKIVINATGIFTDDIRRMDDTAVKPMLAVSQGIHLVLDASFLSADTALMVPKTDDGRVLFAIPWHGSLLLGTTDTPRPQAELEPRPLEEEIAYLLDYGARYLTRKPTRADVRSVFTGLRPLVKAGDSSITSKLARDHTILVSDSGLITITGGKWTTYRKMAEDTVNRAIEVAHLDPKPCRTRELRLHGSAPAKNHNEWSSVYGSFDLSVDKVARELPDGLERLHPRLPYRVGEVLWAAREEMARTVEDVLSRRLRGLLLDAAAAMECAPRVATLMQKELGKDDAWAAEQIKEFESVAKLYLAGQFASDGDI
ncbi:MAG TPA: glycerol-3-phosphate dehydrogenase/oxidase [Verrucomicrobiae bacterium]